MSEFVKTWVEVSKKALSNNARVVLELLRPETQLMAVIKSNAYGHGLCETAKILSKKVDWFGVDNIEEAIIIREHGIKNPILILGYTPAVGLEEAVRYGIRLTCYDYDLLKSWSKNKNIKSKIIKNPKPFNSKFGIHLKIDTGMSRQGVLVSDLSKFLKSIPQDLPIEGVFTHFANADNLQDRTYPNFQLANFKKALNLLNKRYSPNQSSSKPLSKLIVHSSATSGLLTMPEFQFDMVRIGIALYGLWPSIKFRNKFKNLNIEPALSWKTRVVQTKKIKKGTPIGYGITERVQANSKIAILPVGYYDGYTRLLSGRACVLINGQRCKILGRVSMNLAVADISGCPEAKVSDEVILIGKQGNQSITAEELAEKAGTISYEIVSRINPLLPRLYL